MVCKSFFAIIDVPAIATLDQIVIIRGVVHCRLVGNAVREDFGIQHLEDIFIHQTLCEISEGFAFPLFYDFSKFFLLFFAAEYKVIRRALVESVEVLVEPSCYIRMHNRVIPAATLMSGNLLIFVNEDFSVFQVITESLCASQDIVIHGRMAVKFRN